MPPVMANSDSSCRRIAIHSRTCSDDISAGVTPAWHQMHVTRLQNIDTAISTSVDDRA